MAEEKLQKEVRINDFRVFPEGAKLQVFLKGRKKFVKWPGYSGTPESAATEKKIEYDEFGQKLNSALSDDEVIEKVLKAQALVSDGGKTYTTSTPYKVIQDPYQVKVPSKRVYGETPYYLNNGSYIVIKWLDRDGKTVTSDRDFADDLLFFDQDMENLYPGKGTQSVVIEKQIYLYPPAGVKLPNDNPYYVLCYEKFRGDKFVYKEELTKWDSIPYGDKEDHETLFTPHTPRLNLRTHTVTEKDVDIFEFGLINNLKYQYVNNKSLSSKFDEFNKLALCDPSTESCSFIPFYDFLADIDIPTSNTTEESAKQDGANSATSSVADNRLPMIVEGVIDVLKVVAKASFNLVIKIGRAKEIAASEDEELDEEYKEVAFSGPEEQAVVFLNQTIDVPPGLNEYEAANPVDTSIPGPGPGPNSKLVFKSGKYSFLVDGSKGLAGHRLILVLNDLTNYLNANGFPGAKLGNLGIMRDLKESTYPNNPLRAVASLHGAGLAIDVTWSIPGVKWRSISDNANLAKNKELTKAIMSWVKSQGDLTWGAQWGDSNPSQGIVKGRGVDEYHHFEIKSDKIEKYWVPFKDELKTLGFDYKKLNRYGSGSDLERLNKTLLA